MTKTVLQALHEQAASELLIIEPGVSVEKALDSLGRAYRDGSLLEGCEINYVVVGVGSPWDMPSYVWGMVLGLATRYLRQLSLETKLSESELAEHPAENYDLLAVCGREKALAAQADARYQQKVEDARERIADTEWLPY